MSRLVILKMHSKIRIYFCFWLGNGFGFFGVFSANLNVGITWTCWSACYGLVGSVC